MKGEAKQLCHFKPIETKASVNARTHQHVLSKHPGYDSSLTHGAITLLFQHVITDRHVDSQTNKASLIKSAVHDIFESFIKKNETDLDSDWKSAEKTSDKYSHKFIAYSQYNETVFCGYCSKKIWFKNAYRCAYCSYIIHVKCYEKAISTTICPIYLKTNDAPSDAGNTAAETKQTTETDDKKLDCSTARPEECELTEKLSRKGDVSALNQTELSGSKRTVVSNIITGLRQRKWTRLKEKFQSANNSKTNDDFEIVSKKSDQLVRSL
jgi:hypothetical protein